MDKYISLIQNHTRKLFLILIMFLVVSCGGGGSPSSESNDPTIVNTSNIIDPTTVDFSRHFQEVEKVLVSAPTEWNKDESIVDSEILMAFFQKATNTTDQFLENVLLIKIESSEDISNDEDIINYKEVSSKQRSIAGFDGIELIFDANIIEVNDIDFRFMQLAFEFNGFVYALIYSAEKNEFDKNVDIVRFMADSIELGQVVFNGLDHGSRLETPNKPGIATDGGSFLTVSCRSTDEFGFDEIVGRIVNQDRSMSDEFIIDTIHSNPGCRLSSESAVFNGNNYLVTYVDSYLGSYNRVVSKIISPIGDVLSSEPIVISSNTSGYASSPKSVFDGSRVLVVWDESKSNNGYKNLTINGTFIHSDGQVETPFNIATNLEEYFTDINTYGLRPEIAFGDNQFLVTFGLPEDEPYNQVHNPIYGQIIDINGVTLRETAFPIRTDDEGENPRFHQVVFNGNNFTVAWIEGKNYKCHEHECSYKIYTREVTTNGELLEGDADSSGREILPTSDIDEITIDHTNKKQYLDFSFNNGVYKFLWVGSEAFVMDADNELLNFSNAVPIGYGEESTKKLTYTFPNIAHTDEKTLLLWPTRQGYNDSGMLDAWFIEEI